jgi:N-acyl-D-aspartate/D-glutamate deacylase
VVHQRSEADDIINSTQELIDIAKATGVWLHISHMKVCGKKNWGLIDQMLGMLEQAQEEGIRISSTSIRMWQAAPCLGDPAALGSLRRHGQIT